MKTVWFYRVVLKRDGTVLFRSVNQWNEEGAVWTIQEMMDNPYFAGF